MTTLSSFLFYCFSVQSSSLYLSQKLYIAKEMFSSWHFVSPYYLLALKQLQIGRKVCDKHIIWFWWNLERHFSAIIPLINRKSALRCQNRILNKFEKRGRSLVLRCLQCQLIFQGEPWCILLFFKESNKSKRNRSGFSTDPVCSHRNPYGYMFLGDVDCSLDKSESWGLFEEEEKGC